MINNVKERPSTAIVFDFGGVLMDWNPFYLFGKMLGNDPEAVNRFLQDIDFSHWNVEQDRGRSFAEGTDRLIAQFPQYKELIQAYDERYMETIGGAIQPVVDILKALKKAGYPLYGLSNWAGEKFTIVRQNYPFFELFDDVVVSGFVGLVKPDNAIYEELLRRAGRPAGECLFIDDHGPNIHAARELGFQTILYKSPEQLESDLKMLGIL